MISTLDLDIYSAFYQQKKITEKYLGHIPFTWNYSLVSFNADCTEGLSFDLFDKVIIGILLVDEELSITQIGEILGMNVVHDPANQKYKDEAEYDILRAAIDSLVAFKMVETSDIYYDSCRITDIGREYAAKGRKFKFVGNKEFALYFDNTSGNHAQAKELFSRYNLAGKSLHQSDVYLNDAILKGMCLAQQLDIYNPEKGNSFTNIRINSRKSFSYGLMLHVPLYYNLETKEIRLMAYEPGTKTEVEYASSWLNDNKKEEIIDQYLGSIDVSEIGMKFPDAYFADVIVANKAFEKEIAHNPQAALIIAKTTNEERDYTDPLYFWKHVSNFIKPDAKELYLFIAETTADFLEVISQIVKLVLPIPIFIVIEQCRDRRAQALLSSIREYCIGTTRNLFVLETEEVKNTAVWIVTGANTKQYKGISFYSDFDDSKVIIETVGLSKVSLDKSLPVCKKVKKLIAAEYLPLIYKNVSYYAIKQKARNENEIDDKVIAFHNEVANKALVFDSVDLSATDKATLASIKQEIQDLIEFHAEKWKSAISDKLRVLTLSYESKEVNDLAELSSFMVAAEAILVSTPDTFKDVISAANQLIVQLTERKQYIKDELMAKTFVIDTNIFIAEPNVLELISKKDYVALGFRVIEELDKLKMKDDTKDKASAASKNINQFLYKSSKEKNQRVRKTKENLKLLPPKLQNKSADNSILSVACIYKDKNAVILTNDNNLQVKAQMLNIPVLNLDTFKLNVNRS
ncbi:MAG: hypothetical protein JSS82_14345 [Bacteroidetes bacterium]|nr:hypothetical protein [Bacteroidota bacterium]